MTTASFLAVFMALARRGRLLLLPLTALVLVLSGFFELASLGARPPEVSKTLLLNDQAWEASQGVTTDGENFYFSCKFGLIKTKADCKTVLARSADAIPKELQAIGVSHIGGISHYGGKLYCAAEDSKVFEHPYVLVFDAQTLQYTGECYEMDPARHTKGLPWVAVDGETGVLYCAARDNATELMRYDLKSRRYLDNLPLVNDDPAFNLHKIQGGEVCRGVLYTAANDEGQSVARVDLATGRAEVLFKRSLFPGSEGEGLTVSVTSDGLRLHCLDMSPIFLSAYVRTYAISESYRRLTIHVGTQKSFLHR